MKKLTAIIMTLCMLLCVLSGCGGEPEHDADYYPEIEKIRIGALTGPTSMGMVKLMENGNYEFTLSADPAAFAPALAKGDIDMAAVPANLASVIYNNTDGAIKVLAINTLGVLYIVERGDSVQSLADLKGKTLYATGAGAVPEYSLRYLLKENDMDAEKDVSIQWCSDTTEALSYIVNDANAVAMLPQPFVTAAQLQVEDLRIAVDLNEEWEKLGSGYEMVTGVLVARSEFIDEHPDFMGQFIEEYAASVAFVTMNIEEAADRIEQYEIAKKPIALRALPYCNICCMTGDHMKFLMEGYLKALYDMNSAAVGGTLPDNDFYYGT